MQYFLISPTTKGDVYATTFTASLVNPQEFVRTLWTMGDGTVFYDRPSVSHVYNYPGSYRVSLSAWNQLGILARESTTVVVDYVLRDAITFTHLPSSFGYPGVESVSPFTVSLTSAKINEPISLVLQSLNTKSVPHYAVENNKWKFLTPQWKFIDQKTRKPINNSVLLETKPIYKGSSIVAVSASYSFYYIDDLATATYSTDNCPILLIATLSAQNFSYPPESLVYPYYSYSNSEVAMAVVAWQINDVIPTKLKISENYINEVYPTKWKNVPIPITITTEFDATKIPEFASHYTNNTKLLSYPRTNELGLQNTVSFYLQDTITGEVLSAAEDFTIDPASRLYFQAFDEKNNIISGYLLTSITPKITSSNPLVIKATTTANNQYISRSGFEYPIGYPVNSSAYVSHPFGRTINKINLVTAPLNCSNVKYYQENNALIEGSIDFIEPPFSTETNSINYSLSGTSAIYGLAYNPVKNALYAADADLDTIQLYLNSKTLTNTVSCKNITGQLSNTPSYLSIDEKGNVWASLYDSGRVLKFDSDLNYLLQAVPNNIQLSATSSSLSGTGDVLTAPPVVETDSENNIWVSYSYPTNSMLVKFDSNGNQLLSASSLSLSSSPIALSVTPDDSVWVSCYNTDRLELYSSAGTLLSSVSGAFIQPSYNALDKNGNVWFTHGHNFIGMFDIDTNQITSWKVDNKELVAAQTSYSAEDTSLSLSANDIWGGLTIDVYNRVWVIDSTDNTVYVFPAETPLQFKKISILPRSETNYIINSNQSFTTEVGSYPVRSAQAAGDWTGNKWYQKYANGYKTLDIQGQSAPFYVYDLEKSFSIAKVNEEFNCAAYFESLALPEILKSNEKLFTEFFVAVVGDGNLATESIGRVLYERVANFTAAHSELESAEIDQLMSFATQLSIHANAFCSSYPAEVIRLINLFSIPKSRLIGTKKYSTVIEEGMGELLNESSIVTSGEYILCKDHTYDTTELVYVSPILDGSSISNTYTLTFLEVDGLRTPLLENYSFYRYNPQLIRYENNIINWESAQTTLSASKLLEEDMFKDGGTVEIFFNNLLTKRLLE